MAQDLTDGYKGALSDPLSIVLPCTPNDGADLAFVPTSIYVNVAGNISYVPFRLSAPPQGITGSSPGPSWSSPQIVALGVGWHPFRCHRINATGTTATGIMYGTVC